MADVDMRENVTVRIMCHVGTLVPRGNLNLETPPKNDAFNIPNGSTAE